MNTSESGSIDPTSPAADPAAAAKDASRKQSSALWLNADYDGEQETVKFRGGVPLHCQFCVGQRFRRSHLRMSDLPQLLLMRYPVRCTRCGQRQTVSFTIAGASVPSYDRNRQRSSSRAGQRRRSGSSSSQTPGT